MNERARLIELLRDWTDFAPNLADALLAAGVLLIGDHNPHDAEVFRRGWERGHAAQLLEDRLDIPPDLDVERLARALRPLLPQHLEGKGGYPHQSSDTSWTVYDWMTPEALAAAIAAAYREDAG